MTFFGRFITLFVGLFVLAVSDIAYASADKVIVVHARGVAFSQMEAQLVEKSGLNFLRRAYEQGILRPLKPIDNAVTISNIASFETGVMPSVHGIVGHTFGSAENDYSAPVSGFSKTFSVPTFWEKASAAGKSVLNIGALITYGQNRNHNGVDIWAQGRQLTDPGLVDVSEDLSTVELASGLQLILTKEDGLLRVDVEKGTGRGPLGSLKPGEWLDVPLGLFQGRSAAMRLKWLSEKQLYLRGAFINLGAPSSFLDDVEAKTNGSTGWPNIPWFSAGRLDEITVAEEINHELDRIMAVFDYAPQRKNYDLIMIDYPAMDRFGHAMLALAEHGSPEDRVLYRALIDAAFRRMSQDFEIISGYAAQNGYELIIASGHGFSVIHTALNLNAILEKSGLSTGVDWQARGMPGKVSAHIYVRGASVQEKEANIRTVQGIFEYLQHPNTGEVLVDKVFTGSEMSAVGLEHERSGDVFVLLKPGYIFQPQYRSDRPIFDKPAFRGDHGYASNHPESLGMVIASNNDIKHVTDVAGFVEQILGLCDQ